MEERFERRYGDPTAPSSPNTPAGKPSKGFRRVALLRFTPRLGPGAVPGVIFDSDDQDSDRVHLREPCVDEQRKPVEQQLPKFTG